MREGKAWRWTSRVLAAETFQSLQMKKFMFAACAALMSLTMSAQQNTHAVKANPLGFFVGQYQLGYEHALKRQLQCAALRRLHWRYDERDPNCGQC